MWIFTTTGFVSAVRNPDDRTIIVRSRDLESLESISKIAKARATRTPTSDYPYRVEVNPEDFKSWLIKSADSLDYRNFKDEVSIVRGKEFSEALLQVWSTMHKVEDSLARKRSNQ